MAYSKPQLAKVLETLRNWRDATRDSLDNEESRDNPNGDRVDNYTQRLDGLESAIEALEAIE